MALVQTLFQSPTQASDIFTRTGRFPKQQHAFLVRFVMNNNAGDANLTFAVKTADRPTINITTQELSQYNKKRVIYTGYKNADMNIDFYDTADQAAQGLWATYSQYYFGDFAQSYSAFNDDIENASSNWLANLGSAGFGYTAANGGQKSFGTQFLIKYIELLHFNNGTYDTYTMINPKISTFKLDALDYSSAEVSTVSMTFQYEAVIISPGSGGASSQSIEEFQDGQPFNGNPLEIPGTNQNIPSEFYVSNATSNDSITANILAGLFGKIVGSTTTASNSNYYNSGNGSGLGLFGNFIFGAVGNALTSPTLAQQSINNPGLTAALGLSTQVNTAIYPVDAYGIQTGVASDAYNSADAVASSASSNSVATGILAAGLLTDAALGNSNSAANTLTGLALSAAALGAINAQRSGTSQYGYNPQISNGNNYGPQGEAGYTAPQTPTPYTPAQPFGAYTPVPVTATPLAPLVNNPKPSSSNTGATINPTNALTSGYNLGKTSGSSNLITSETTGSGSGSGNYLSETGDSSTGVSNDDGSI